MEDPKVHYIGVVDDLPRMSPEEAKEIWTEATYFSLDPNPQYSRFFIRTDKEANES